MLLETEDPIQLIHLMGHARAKREREKAMNAFRAQAWCSEMREEFGARNLADESRHLGYEFELCAQCSADFSGFL